MFWGGSVGAGVVEGVYERAHATRAAANREPLFPSRRRVRGESQRGGGGMAGCARQVCARVLRGTAGQGARASGEGVWRSMMYHPPLSDALPPPR